MWAFAARALTIGATFTLSTNFAAISTILLVPVEVCADAAAVSVAQIAPALTPYAVGVLDAGVATQAAVASVVLEIGALACTRCQVIFTAGSNLVVGAT